MPLTKAVLISVTTLCAACGSGDRAGVEHPTSAISLEIGRLDKDLFRSSPDTMREASLKAQATYGTFYRTYIEEILQGAPLDDPRLPLVLNRFVLDPDWRDAQQAIDSVLGDLRPEQRAFETAFTRLRTHFPDSLVPRIIAFNSGYNYGIYPTDSVLGIGLEWFIGRDHPVIGYLDPTTFPQYVKDRMVPAMLVPSAVKGWLMVHYLRDTQGQDVLTNLVETGKVMALLDDLLPATDPHLKFAFTPGQLRWCEENEFNIWKEVVAKDKLFSKRTEDIGRLLNDGPFTNGFPRESPGHIGEWVGYRMVQAHRKANPKLSFRELLAMEDAREILKSYKPR
jgi:hypothetical protein